MRTHHRPAPAVRLPHAAEPRAARRGSEHAEVRRLVDEFRTELRQLLALRGGPPAAPVRSSAPTIPAALLACTEGRLPAPPSYVASTAAFIPTGEAAARRDAEVNDFNARAAAETWNRQGPAFDWNATGKWLSREGGDGSTHALTINVPNGYSGQIELAGGPLATGLPNADLNAVKLEARDATGRVLFETDYMNSNGFGGRFNVTEAKGPITLTATYRGAGNASFNCLHEP